MCTLRGMRKTSVYLPEELKTRLAAAAAQAGSSEAEFIRGAIEAAVQHGGATGNAAPRGHPPIDSADRIGVGSGFGRSESPTPRLVGPLLVGVGVGPGAADLLTTRARDVIRQADTVVAAAISPDAIGRAEATVRAALGPLRVVRLAVDVNGSSESRTRSLPALAERLVDHLDRREVVAFLTIGDPNMFSVFPSVAAAVRAVRPEVAIASVPGVMAFQELAARAGTVVGDHQQSVRIIAVGNDLDNPAARIADTLARADETLVLYRGGRSVPAITRQLISAGRARDAVVGELLGLPGERCAPAGEYVDQPASYLASLIAPAPGAA
jgi:precorrin-2/cobalt-factor-2 C20-methyltransferase